MCDPASGIALASFAIGTASSYMQYQSQVNNANEMAEAQNQAIRDQQAYQQKLIELENQRSMTEANAIRTRQLQEQQAMARERQKVSQAGASQRSTAIVSAGEAGVSGLSVDALLADFKMQELNYQESISSEQKNRDAYYMQQLEQNRVQSAFTMAELNRPITSQPIARPSGLAFGIGIAGQAVGSYKDYLNYGGGTKPERKSRSTLAIAG
jgi:hypothetical protein